MDNTIDIGDRCTHCGRDTAFGTGLFVNRIPSGAEWSDETLEVVEVYGYMCAECQTPEGSK